jgi:PKHD-type hydroxylase
MPRHFVFPKNHSDSQNYYYFSDGISNDELKKLFDDVALIPQQRATTVASDDTSVRSSIVKWLPQNDQWSWLYDKMINMATIANNALWNFDLQTAPEQIQFTEYHASQGGHYGWHQDIGPGMLSLRKVSITVQLSGPEDYQGGDLQIWQGGDNPIDAPKGKGTVVIFPSYMMHRVTKVTSGVRRSLVLWVGGEHYR